MPPHQRYPKMSAAEASYLHFDNGQPVLRVVEDLAPRIHAREAAEMPDADALAATQFVEACQRLHEDTTDYPQFPWPSLAALSGPLCPEDLVLVAARTGGGKSLFLQNLFDALIRDGRAACYIGLEQHPKILRVKWACLCSDVAPKFLLATRCGERDTPEWHRAMDLVQAELKWQQTQEIRALAHFAATRKIDAAGLKRWTEWAVDLGCEVVIVDHVDRMQHGAGTNAFHELSETIRLAKELAAEHQITMILASQVSRPGDALERFMPPALHNMRGAGTKEEEADTVLGVYRPLRVGVKDGELKAVRQGLRDIDTVIEPNVMGVMLLKHRLDGPVAGKIVQLAVKHQRVTDLPERDRHSAREFAR